MFNFSFLEKLVLYEIMCKRVVESGRPQMKIWRMCTACWNYINKYTLNFLPFIDFPLQKLLRQHVPMLRYMSYYFSWNFRAPKKVTVLLSMDYHMGFVNRPCNRALLQITSIVQTLLAVI